MLCKVFDRVYSKNNPDNLLNADTANDSTLKIQRVCLQSTQQKDASATLRIINNWYWGRQFILFAQDALNV